MQLVRCTVTAEGFTSGWTGYVDETAPIIIELLEVGYLTPVGSFPIPPLSQLMGDVTGDFQANHIAPRAVTSDKIDAGAVDTSILAPQAVTIDKVSPSGGTNGQVIGITGGVPAWIAQSGGGGGGDPTMGGDLSGTASTAQIVAGAVGSAEIATAIKDAAAATASLRTLGTGAAQAAAGSHTHALDDLSDVATAGAASGNLLGFSGGNWVPVPGSGGAVTLDSLTDVDVSTATDGMYLGRVSGAWTGVPPPGGTITLDSLADVTAPAPVNGQVLSFSGGQWVNAAAGTGAVTWLDFPESYGATGDAKAVASGFSVSSGTVNGSPNVATFTGQSLSGKAGYQVSWRTPGGVETAIIKSVLAGNQTATLGTVASGGSTFYTAAATVSAVNCVVFNTADTTAWQAMLTAAKGTHIGIGVKPNQRYGITASLDASNWKSPYIAGQGVGRPYMDRTGVITNGGAWLLACAATPITVIRAGTTDASDSISHAGLHLERLGIGDPLAANIHTGVLTQFQTRSRIYNCHYANLAIGHVNNSGVKDGSWSAWVDNTWMSNTVSMRMFNALSDPGFTSAPTGAMADSIRGGNFNIMAGQTGIDWFGGQYADIGPFKMDLDGAGSCCIRLRGGVNYAQHGTGAGSDATTNYAAGTSPSPGKTTIIGVRVEATGSSLDATSVCFDVWGGASTIQFVGCDIGGGGGVGGNGYWLGVSSNGSARLDGVKIIGGSTLSKSVGVTFGPYARGAMVFGHYFGGSVGTKYALWQAGAQDCSIIECQTDAASNPIIDASKFDYGTAGVIRPWIRGIVWAGGSCDHPAFSGAPPVTFGRDGALAYNSLAHTQMVRLNGSWLTLAAT